MREKISLDQNWLFHKGDVAIPCPTHKATTYHSAKTERRVFGPAAKQYFADNGKKWEKQLCGTEEWTSVDLPHDYVIEEQIDKNQNGSLGFVRYENAWYIKYFDLSEEDRSKRVVLYFEGIATTATVYVNGILMKNHFSGYAPFEVDITDVAEYDGRNVVSVYVNTQEHEGWWYEGGGIYRHVWLIKTALVSVDLYGVFAKPSLIGDNRWEVNVETALRNDEDVRRAVKVSSTILDPDGAELSSAENEVFLQNRAKDTLRCSLPAVDPVRWSPENPYQYVLRTELYVGAELVDTYDVKFGFRSFYIDPEKGLFINDRHYKVKGLCGHADCGLTGKAVPDNLHRYKVRLMKEMGANGYRTSHYPQAEALMDALDENGFIVMDETRWFDSSEEGVRQLETLIRRDRNRPSVFFWSIGNEEPLHETEKGHRISRTLKAVVDRLDGSRPVTTAVCHHPDSAPVFDDLDLIGVNYNLNTLETLHRKYPQKGILSAEIGACGTTRGWYFPKDSFNAILPAYDDDALYSGYNREATWKIISANDWIIGAYLWTSFDHRGEAVWPRICSQSGAIDLFLQKKDAFYQNQSYWIEEPMVHLLPHWNFRGMEGMPVKVVAYTNAEAVELFVNGESQGRKTVERCGHGEWCVPYEPGKIEVLAYHGNAIVAKDSRETTGEGKSLRLRQDTSDVSANGKDLAIFTCTVVDEEGRPVPDAMPLVRFSAFGDCKIYSTGSGVTDHSSLFSSERKMVAGTVSVAVKVGKDRENMRIMAAADRLESAIVPVVTV